MKVFWPTLVVLVLDQLTKLWVRSTMAVGDSIPVIGRDFFRLTHVENTGVAFGMQPFGVPILALFSALASVVLIYLLIKSQKPGAERYPKLVEFALALILGGALGNLIDRIVFGHVTDFFDFDFPDFLTSRWPVFNIADSAVTIGVTLWCVYLVFFSKQRDDKNKVIANEVKQSG